MNLFICLITSSFNIVSLGRSVFSGIGVETPRFGGLITTSFMGISKTGWHVKDDDLLLSPESPTTEEGEGRALFPPLVFVPLSVPFTELSFLFILLIFSTRFLILSIASFNFLTYFSSCFLALFRWAFSAAVLVRQNVGSPVFSVLPIRIRWPLPV